MKHFGEKINRNKREVVKNYLKTAYELSMASAKNSDVKLGVEDLYQRLSETSLDLMIEKLED